MRYTTRVLYIGCMRYEMLRQQQREQLRRFLDLQRTGAQEYARWNSALVLEELTPRPHMRPVKQVVREKRTHMQP